MSLILSLLLLQSAAATPPPATPPADAKIVCKTINPTGSRLDAKRICMSKLEWRRLQKENEQSTREIQDSHSKQGDNQ